MGESLTARRKRPADTLLYGLVYFCAFLSVALLALILIYVVVRGVGSVNWQFLTTVTSKLKGTVGIAGNLLNTLMIVVLTMLVALPVGVGAAVYLNEYAKPGKLVSLIEFATETLSGIPSILFGLFGSMFFGETLHLGYSLLTGALTLTLMVLPLITRNTQEALKTVPDSYRHGAVGLGAGKWYTIRTVLLPSAMPGILTGAILAVGRIVGESAALLFTAGAAKTLPKTLGKFFAKIFQSGGTLTIQLYLSATSEGDFSTAFGIAVVLLAVVLLSSDYCIRSILNPVAEITEKAQRIASGSYGVQIQTSFKDEIGDLADTINEMSTKIAQNEKMQAEFVSQLSHELRTPLTVINGWSETLLAGDDLNDDTRQGMKIISSEAKRLTEMVMDLLDFTRMQDGRMTLAVEMTDIRGEFEDTVYMYGGRLAQDGIQLVYLDNDEDIPEIPCDPQRMRQVFLNLLDNAAKHGGSGKRIEASMSYDGKDVIVYIRDFGPGIPEDELPLVKKKFYKGSSSVRGTGIGLAVCDEIVEMHGGTLTLENAEGGGTLVTIRLPAEH